MFNPTTMGAIASVATNHFWSALPADTNFAATAEHSKYGKCGIWDSIG